MGTILIILTLVLVFNAFSYRFPEEVISFRERVIVNRSKHKDSVFNSEDLSSFNLRVMKFKKQSKLRMQVISILYITFVFIVMYQLFKDLV